ncbi:hypothetical protein KXD93_29580 [Mucilaginibacter sp. BJC16-A38]|uniref:hypothetical protein n=1 Tax=Mucilaginibacter phenanthrenivorans TaxID=1234842 RepID=UPI0021572DE0|nr:hypothetical protein [Mucilaginibacter phenanthrenivorans]MCR8561843.1 hypothetical protein [Mucilaginibacter phenanthrenivorans]
MRRLILLLTILLIVVMNFNTSAQIITKYGDNVSTLDGIIKAYYDVVTVKKGGKVFFERDSLIHWPGVLVGAVSVSKSGKPAMHYLTLKEYHRLSDASLEKDGFDEREISRKVEKFGAIYHVWSTYESRNEAGGPIIERGINSIELFYDGTRFWIMGWIYDGERKNNPIPAEYLN